MWVCECGLIISCIALPMCEVCNNWFLSFVGVCLCAFFNVSFCVCVWGL